MNCDKDAYYGKLQTTAEFLKKLVPSFPRIGVVLGSGLGGVADEATDAVKVPYGEIPNMPKSSIEGHAGILVIGKLDGVPVVLMKGRVHFYEGHPMSEVVLPLRAIALAGASHFVLTNATGGMRAEMNPPSLCLIRDHINLMGSNPLIGSNDTRLGPRFPDSQSLYDPTLSQIFVETAKRIGVKLHEGTYVAVHGPSFETPAEIKMYRTLGGDVVGMSTVPEVIALGHMGRKVAVVSCVTNLAAGLTSGTMTHAEVMENADKARVMFAKLIRESVKQFEV